MCTTRPGDYNQAIMEFGSTFCTPRNPKCDACPLQDMCLAYQTTHGAPLDDSAEEGDACDYCQELPTDTEPSVVQYPLVGKPAKKRLEGKVHIGGSHVPRMLPIHCGAQPK
jgi:A/G-specific adenine glycosylase